jgi:hypothetical protein
VHIPLDYYRILGLPIQATVEQLQQAHRDRGLQLPRREFSEVAIVARKQLIDEAYEVLAHRDRRREYDSTFLANAYSVDLPEDAPALVQGNLGVNPDVGEAALRSLATEPGAGDASTSTIDIDPEQFAGALLILLELGEYEQVIHLGRPYLSSGSATLADGHLGDPVAVQADVVLTLALACLELGREQWQQRQYETAAESLETGHELLAKENQFPTIRAEIQAELYKLRPYRILELLARPLDQTRERRQGLKLLKTMLEDRGGIEGTEDDLSGLAIDDFLRFIQQLRDYLTASEQQELFEHEARRPSPVATYLTVYALLARGFARHQPALVRRAKQLLMRLGGQQDVHLEQAVCAMLLGQTEEANRALELSQEYEPLAYIREHSRNSPDLLPGLCLYTERWLKDELFPHFRDFKDQEATLKDYFSDPQVQNYLESMMGSPEAAWEEGGPLPQGPNPSYGRSQFPTVEGSLPIGAPSLAAPSTLASSGRRPQPPSSPPPLSRGTGYQSRSSSSRNGHAPERPNPEPPPSRNGKARPGHPAASRPTPTDPTHSFLEEAVDLGELPESVPSVAERVAQLSPEGQLQPATASLRDSSALQAKNPKTPAQPPASRAAAMALAPGQAFPPTTQKTTRRSEATTSPHWGRLVLVGAVGLFGLGILGFTAMRTAGWVAGAFSGPRLSGRPLAISVTEPAVEIPNAPGPGEQIGVNDMAQRVIEEWLSVKRASLGKDYQSDGLEGILVEPVLTQWRRRADAAPQENWYWEYEHTVAVQSVTPDDPTADQLQVTAVVTEKARLFEYGVENTSASYDDELTMRYDLVRKEGNWYIQNMGKLSGSN